MKRLSTLQNIYVNTKVCIPESFSICEKIEDLWKVTLFKNPNNDYYQMMITDENFYVNPILEKPTEKYHCFSGEPDLERMMTGNGN